MGQFVIGEIVSVTFPFSNLKGQKRRPALVVAKAEFHNYILCQITSKPYSSRLAMLIEKNDFTEGYLPVSSYIRPDKLFTSDPTLINKSMGKLTSAATDKILTKIRNLFTPIS